MSPGFDGSGYRQRVLAVLQGRSPLLLDDPFFVVDLEPDAAATASDAELRTHVRAVVAFLQRERNSAKYKTLAAELIGRRADWEGILLDPARRAAAREAALAGRRESDAERYGKVDGYLSTVRERFGGIPRARVDGLRRLAAAAGVPAAEFDARLSRERIIEDGAGGGVEPLPSGVRRQIRDQLAELDRLRGGDRAGTSSLWAFLGVPPGADPARLRAAYDTLGERNARRGHDREMTVTADLLAQVRTRLIDSDPAAYTVGLVADAKEAVRPRVEEHVVLDDGLNPVATEGLVREVLGLGLGLSGEQARSVVLDVARELGAAVTTGAAVDYVICAHCGRPEQGGGSRACRYCGADLYLACPSCGREAEVAAIVCRHCGQNTRQAREVAEALARVRRALAAGHPRAAAEVLAHVRPLMEVGGGAPAAQYREFAARVQAALGAAEAGWRALIEDLAAHRVQAASDGVRWLSNQASDVSGPDGRPVSAVVDELSAQRDVVRRRVAAARALPPDQREAALTAVLRTAADDREALAALAALPLPPVTDLTSTTTDEAIVLRWRASGSGAPVSYKVVRIVEEPSPGGTTRSERSLGITQAVELSDAGVPAGVPVSHEVIATSGGRRAEPVRTSPTIVVRDVSQVRAELVPDGVALSWRLDAARDGVVIDRTIDPSSSVGGPTRRITASGGRYIDPDVQAGVTYRYHVRVEYTQLSGATGRTPGAEVAITVTPRPRPVLDLAVDMDGGGTTLRWSSIPGSTVQVYAAVAGSAAAAAVPPIDSELPGG
ncbi:MAG: zinc ribbon domain-containing protein, partial [Frankia sp.]